MTEEVDSAADGARARARDRSRHKGRHGIALIWLDIQRRVVGHVSSRDLVRADSSICADQHLKGRVVHSLAGLDRHAGGDIVETVLVDDAGVAPKGEIIADVGVRAGLNAEGDAADVLVPGMVECNVE